MKLQDCKKYFKRGLVCIGFILLSLCLFVSDVHGYSSQYSGTNSYDTSGGCYFEIRGGPSGNSRIHINFKRKSGATSYNSIMNNSSTWTVSIYAPNSTNRHNITVVDTSVTTKLDVTNCYNVLSFRIAYDMPAHYQYSSYSADAPGGMRMNVLNYNKDNSGSNSAAASGSHSGSTTRRTINIQVNTGNTGLRTYNKYWYYNCTLAMNIAKPTRTVTQYHYYRNEVNNTWNHFNTTSTSVTDANYFSPYNVGAPSGYYPGNNYGYYNSVGVQLGSGTVGQNSFHVCGDNYTVHVHYYPYYYYLDLNGMLDGVSSGGISGFGTADVYINGSLVDNDVSDYYAQHPYGSTYQISDIRATTGHTYNGVYSGSLSGTINGNKSVVLSFSTNNYINHIGHWAGGFVHGEGNNGGKNMYNLANTTFTAKYGSTYSMNSSKQTTIPKGFYLGNTFGSPSINGSWGSYNIGTSVTQKAAAMSYEYYYYPYTYSINYNLDGGTNNSSNPSSYNVLYGVNLSAPRKKGYDFLGWYNGDTKLNGINQGANASFTSANDMYSKLNSRTTGNITLTAKWNKEPEINAPDISQLEDNAYIENGKIILQLGENFTPSLYATANDYEDGDLTSKIQIINNVPLVNGKTSASGTYTVIYSVADSQNATTTKTLTVIVNQPPTLTTNDRVFFLNQYHITPQELLKKIIANDKEDGNISSKIVINSIEYADRVETSITYLDTSQLGDIKLNYSVTDKYRKTVNESLMIHIVQNDSDVINETKRVYRFISQDYLNTLEATSLWKTDLNLNNQLKSSVSSQTAMKTIKFSSDEVKNVQNYMNQNDYKKSSETNSIFASLFLNK